MVVTDTVTKGLVPATPTKKESRRRSWFGLVTPTRNKERAAVIKASVPPVTPPKDEAVEELDVTPVRPSAGTGDGSLRDFAPYFDQDDPNTTVKRRGHVDEGRDAVRAALDEGREGDGPPKQPFSSRIFSRSASSATSNSNNSTANASAASTPGAVDMTSKQSLNPATTIASVITPSRVPRRTSSIRPGAETPVDDDDPDSSPVNKALPPIPFHDPSRPDVFSSPSLHIRDGSLPSLPSTDESGPTALFVDAFSIPRHRRDESLPSLPSASTTDSTHSFLQSQDHHMARSGSVPVPVPNSRPPPPLAPLAPTDIVVTPSSPLDRDPFEATFAAPGRSRPGSAPVSRSPSYHVAPQRSESPTPTNARSLGLGLPSPSRRQSAQPQRWPNGQQTVSMPLPETGNRAVSPATKVSFISPNDDKSHDRETKDPIKIKQPRPRSFSAIFNPKPPILSQDTDDDEPPPKFNWLNVRKTIKRRRSESKLKKSGAVSDNEDGSGRSIFKERNNRSTPMLLGGRGAAPPMPGRPASTTPGAQSSTASSSFMASSFTLPALEQSQPFWEKGGQWTASPTAEVEEMFSTETDSRGSHTHEGSTRDSHSLRRERPRLETSASQRSSLASVSPLGSLPEIGVPPAIAESALEPPPPVLKAAVAGRGRSLSDATRRQHSSPALSPALSSAPRSPWGMGSDVPPSPNRPPLFTHQQGSTSALNKVRNALGMSTRPRSNSGLRYGSADERDREDSTDTPYQRPESSASSSYASPALAPVRIRPEDVPQVSTVALHSVQVPDDDRRIVITETPERSPRSSYTASLASRGTHRSHTADPHSLQPAPRAQRARASTIGSGASFAGTFGQHQSLSTTFLPATAQQQPLFPTAATPPRARTGSIRRLSTGLLRTAPNSPRPTGGGLFPLPARTSGGALGGRASPIPGVDDGPGGIGTRRGSILPPTSEQSSPAPVPVETLADDDQTEEEKKKAFKALIEVREDDTPESWLERLDGVSRRELAGVIAHSADKFHADALKSYMGRFEFTHIALDVALRRLLMHMSLPKETQQIDRVMEAFASRYDVCEPGLFGAKDNGYVLAFSMMMLHTDAFNRHNKNKMTKADYVRNTRLDGVPEPVLEAFYDNITFTPFVFIEDDSEAALAARGGSVVNLNAPAMRQGKIDVYDLIVGGQLGTLRVDIEQHIPADSPFSCMGTQPFLDVDRLQRQFANSLPLQFTTPKTARRKSSVVNLTSALGGSGTPKTPPADFSTLKITKVGLINRKEDTLVNGKKPSGRKWKNWSMVLTGSQLLFFKDTVIALTLVERIRATRRTNPDDPLPTMSDFQPDEVFTVKDCVAVFDREHPVPEPLHTFRFVMPDGREYLMEAPDEYQMNEWLTLINYASTFKSAAIRMRAPGLNSEHAVLAGAAAAESHRRDLADGTTPPPTNNSQTRAVLFADEPVADARPKLRRVGSMRASPAPVVDITGANDVVVGGSEQLEAVIGQVKAELAAGRGQPQRTWSMPTESDTPPKTSRTDAITERIGRLRTEAAPLEQRLAANLRIARNLAILTPFQKTTRDRIEAQLPELATQIRTDRIQLAKLHLWITMLLKDQDRDQRDWARVRHVAMQAATQTLAAPQRTSKADRRATIATPITIPTLALPHDDWEDRSPNVFSSSPNEFPLFVRQPSDDGPPSRDSRDSRQASQRNSGSDYDGPGSARRPSSEYLSASSAFGDEVDKALGQGPEFDEFVSLEPSPIEGVSASGRSTPAQDEAEHWRQTRAATKVSLASLPRSGFADFSQKLKWGAANKV
ncbi:hypothetical protein Q8F55_004013 [Vanrija albida]|uniref:SEC7 domain-containing protein n=1 Tax=Vanrija albida TaxID=181172 RepID=A0ABR3Q6D1_9TREE